MTDTAIILAGGLGTRLREETEFRPKPMVEVGGKPIIWHIMKNLAAGGIDHFIIATGYRSNVIKDYFINYDSRNSDFSITLGDRESLTIHDDHEEANWRVTLAYTGELTNTGGRVLEASKYLKSGPFMVVYGDGLANVNVREVIDFHNQGGKLATVTATQPTSRFGVLDIDSDGTVSNFDEKPTLDGWVNIGFFVMESECLEFLLPDCVLEEQPLRELAARSQLSAFRHRGYWQPMDTYREALLLNELWNSGRQPWRVQT